MKFYTTARDALRNRVDALKSNGVAQRDIAAYIRVTIMDLQRDLDAYAGSRSPVAPTSVDVPRTTMDKQYLREQLEKALAPRPIAAAVSRNAVPALRWLSIPGFKGRYEITIGGSIRSYARRGRALKPSSVPHMLKPKKPGVVAICGKTYSVRKLVERTFGA
jgi:hypothetical protein